VSKIVFTPKAEEPATEATITVPETITDGKFYYTTFSSDKALDFSDVEGIEAYTGVKKIGTDAYLTLTQVEQIPANTGVVIKAAKAKDYTIPFAEGDVEAPEANDLIAAVETVSISLAIICHPSLVTTSTSAALMVMVTFLLALPICR